MAKMRLRFLLVAFGLLIFGSAAHAQNCVAPNTSVKPNDLITSGAYNCLTPQVGSNLALSRLATSAVPGGVWRTGFVTAGDTPPLWFQTQTGTCVANSMVSDGGSCQNAGDGNSFAASYPNNVADIRQWGCKGDGVFDNTSCLQAAINASIGYATGKTLAFPTGTFLHNTVTVRGFNLQFQGAGRDKTVFAPLTSGTLPWQIGSSSDPNPWLGTFVWSTAGITFKNMTFNSQTKNTIVIKLDPSAQQVRFQHVNVVSDIANNSVIYDQSDESDYEDIDGFCTNNTSFLIDWDTWGHNQHMANSLFQGGSGGIGTGCSGVRITQGAYSSFSTSITSITRSGTTATATTATTIPAAMYVGAGIQVNVSGATQTQYNGSVSATVTSANTFNYTVSGSPTTPATGTITAVLDPRASLHRVEGATIDSHTVYIASGPYAV